MSDFFSEMINMDKITTNPDKDQPTVIRKKREYVPPVVEQVMCEVERGFAYTLPKYDDLEEL